MTFAATGTFVQAAATSVTSTTISLSNQGIGDLLLLEVHTTSKTVWCSSVSGGGCTWVQIGSVFSGAVNTASAVVFAGTVTATGAQTATITLNGTATVRAAGQEFTSTAGQWSLDAQGNLDSAGTNTMPSLTPTGGAGELYFCFEHELGTATAGATAGYTYDVATPANGLCFNAACTSAAQAPVWGDSTCGLAIAVLLREGGGAPPLTLDASTPAVKIDGGAGSSGTTPYPITSNAFSPPGGSVIVVTYETGMVSTGSYDLSGTYPTIADSLGTHLSWSQVASVTDNAASPFPHRVAVWWAYAGAAAPGSITITCTDVAATGQISTGGTVSVKVWANANIQGPVGAVSSSGAFASNTTLSVALTPTTVGSAVFLAACSDGSANSVTGAGMVATDSSGAHYIQEWPGTLTTSLSPVTLTETVSTAAEWQYIAYEVLPSARAWAEFTVRPMRGRMRQNRARTSWPPVTSVTVIDSTGAALTGTGSLTAAAVESAPAALAGTGSLAAAAVQAAPAALAGTGALTAAGTGLAPATLSGTGSVTATPAAQAPAALAGTGSLTAAAAAQAPAALAAAGSLGAPAVITAAPAALAGAGSLTTAAAQQAPATLAGTGSLTAPAVQRAPAALAGTGSVTAAGTVTGSQAGAATLSGTGSLTAAAVQAAPAVLAAAGSVTAPSLTGAPAALTGTGSLTGAAVQAAPAALTGTGSLAAAAAESAPAALTGAGTITGSGTVFASGAAALTGQGSLAAAGRLLAPAALNGTGSLTALAAAQAAALLAGTGSITAAGTVTVAFTTGALAGATALTGMLSGGTAPPEAATGALAGSTQRTGGPS